MIFHTPHPDEAHYFPLHHSPNRRILLHTHSPAPFIDSWVAAALPGLNFTVYSVVQETRGPLILTVEIDWSATVGRWVIRYPTTVVIWSRASPRCSCSTHGASQTRQEVGVWILLKYIEFMLVMSNLC